MEPNTVQTDPNSLSPCGQNPSGRQKRSPAQMAASLQNIANSTGRPMRILVDWREWERLRHKGLTIEAIANQLGINRRTLRRRMVERFQM